MTSVWVITQSLRNAQSEKQGEGARQTRGAGYLEPNDSLGGTTRVVSVCLAELSLPCDDKWAIDILVKFRDTEKLQLLTAQRQSGGVSLYRHCLMPGRLIGIVSHRSVLSRLSCT